MEFYHVVGERSLELLALADEPRKECIDFVVSKMTENRTLAQVRELTCLVEADIEAQDAQLQGLMAVLRQQHASNTTSNDLIHQMKVLEIKLKAQELDFDGFMNIHRGVVEEMREMTENAQLQLAMSR